MTPEEMLIVEARHAYASEIAQGVFKGVYESSWNHWDKLSQDERDEWVKYVRDKNSSIPNPLENEYQWP